MASYAVPCYLDNKVPATLAPSDVALNVRVKSPNRKDFYSHLAHHFLYSSLTRKTSRIFFPLTRGVCVAVVGACSVCLYYNWTNSDIKSWFEKTSAVTRDLLEWQRLRSRAQVLNIVFRCGQCVRELLDCLSATRIFRYHLAGCSTGGRNVHIK